MNESTKNKYWCNLFERSSSYAKTKVYRSAFSLYQRELSLSYGICVEVCDSNHATKVYQKVVPLARFQGHPVVNEFLRQQQISFFVLILVYEGEISVFVKYHRPQADHSRLIESCEDMADFGVRHGLLPEAPSMLYDDRTLFHHGSSIEDTIIGNGSDTEQEEEDAESTFPSICNTFLFETNLRIQKSASTAPAA